jgi:hypothetical protein
MFRSSCDTHTGVGVCFLLVSHGSHVPRLLVLHIRIYLQVHTQGNIFPLTTSAVDPGKSVGVPFMNCTALCCRAPGALLLLLLLLFLLFVCLLCLFVWCMSCFRSFFHSGCDVVVVQCLLQYLFRFLVLQRVAQWVVYLAFSCPVILGC